MKIQHQELMENLFFRSNCAHTEKLVLQFLQACKDAGIKTTEQAFNEVQAYINAEWEKNIKENNSLLQK